MSLFPILLMAAATQPPTLQTSPLATPETTHEWVMLSDDKNGTGWYDKTFEDTILFEGQSYPVVLIRFVIQADGSANVGDMLLAVNCTDKQMAVVAGWLQAKGEVIANYDSPEGITFDFAEQPFDKEDIILFKYACGEGWST